MTTLPVVVTRGQHRDARAHCEAADDASLTSTGLMLDTGHVAQRLSARPPDVKHPDLTLEPAHDGVTLLMDGDGVGVGQLVQVIDALVGPRYVNILIINFVEMHWLVSSCCHYEVIISSVSTPLPVIQTLGVFQGASVSHLSLVVTIHVDTCLSGHSTLITMG